MKSNEFASNNFRYFSRLKFQNWKLKLLLKKGNKTSIFVSVFPSAWEEGEITFNKN